MNVLTVAAGKFRALPFTAPRRRVVEFTVRSDEPVNTYVVSPDGLGDLRGGDPIRAYGGFDRRKRHHQVVGLSDLRAGDPWYLVIYNPNEGAVEVDYEVLY